MGSHVAASRTPFDGRLREHEAVCAGSELFGFLAAITFFNNGVATAPVELAAILAHEKAVNTLFYTCTNHGYHILSLGLKTSNQSLCQNISRMSSNKIANPIVLVNDAALQNFVLSLRRNTAKDGATAKFMNLSLSLE